LGAAVGSAFYKSTEARIRFGLALSFVGLSNDSLLAILVIHYVLIWEKCKTILKKCRNPTTTTICIQPTKFPPLSAEKSSTFGFEPRF
jgi:hypothetical protein